MIGGRAVGPLSHTLRLSLARPPRSRFVYVDNLRSRVAGGLRFDQLPPYRADPVVRFLKLLDAVLDVVPETALLLGLAAELSRLRPQLVKPTLYPPCYVGID